MDWSLLTAELSRDPMYMFYINLFFCTEISSYYFFFSITFFSTHVLPAKTLSLTIWLILYIHFFAQKFFFLLHATDIQDNVLMSSEDSADSLQVMTVACCDELNVCVLKFTCQNFNPGVMILGDKVLGENEVMRAKLLLWVRYSRQ